MLRPAEVDSISEKRGSKQNSVGPDSFAGGEMVLTLLAKVITFYVAPTAVNVRDLGLELVSGSSL